MQSVFERYEKKYIATREQAAALYGEMKGRMQTDRFGEYLVQNLYYDAENWDVIRASIEKPPYKEKMRLRCYGIPNRDSKLFLELKKKYKGIVYKRRITLPASKFAPGKIKSAIAENPSQIARELDFYRRTNAVSEKIFISYRRKAYAGIEDESLRVTFDADVLFRLDQFDFYHPDDGRLVLPQGKTLIEVKTSGGMPPWLARALNDHAVYPTSFSKFGACYTGFILNQPPCEEKPMKRRTPISA